MKAPDFGYEKPENLEHALALLSETGRNAAPLAGGQSLMPILNFRMSTPDLLVDLNSLNELKGITEDGNNIVIGAMTRHAELDQSPIIARHLPLITMALPHIAHPAIRNRGTIGGSLAMADPAAELPAIALALDARITAQSVSGTRDMEAKDFFLGFYQTALIPGELISRITFPRTHNNLRFAFYELARRHGDYAMAGAAIAVMGKDPIEDIRIALFGIATRPLRAEDAEAALKGKSLTDPAAIDAALNALSSIEFNGDLNAAPETKHHLAKVVLKRALAELDT